MPLPVPARRTAAVATLVATLLVVAVAVGPVGAKEFLQGRLDAPIAFDSPPGAILLVGLTVEGPGEDGEMTPVEGSPIYLKLVGKDGTWTREMGEGDRRPPGHYTFRIAVPEGGVRDAEVGMSGNYDLPFMWQASPVTFGPITAATAQLAPPPAGAANAPPAEPAAQAPAAPDPAATTPATAAGPSNAPAWAALGVALAAVALALAAVVLLRRARGAPSARAPDGAPGA